MKGGADMSFEGTVQQAFQSLTPQQQETAYQFILFLGSMPKVGDHKKSNISFDSLRGKILISDDFDAPLPEFAEYM